MILATTKVEDFDRFLNFFSTKGAEKRKQHGSKGATVFRDPNEDDRVWVLFDWDGEGWQNFVSDPRFRRSFKNPGTKVGPRRPSSAASTTPRTARPGASSATNQTGPLCGSTLPRPRREPARNVPGARCARSYRGGRERTGGRGVPGVWPRRDATGRRISGDDGQGRPGVRCDSAGQAHAKRRGWEPAQ